ncbi:thioredoxin domain-containing protein [Corynebacterium pseudodiphtheriticum]|uniref:DsbA family protein n=1 Tax=Corynebacterium pseudodiphtheriticum TaxID=37637 RepID=UPI00254C762D|nr:thioredoxin domain-containing protein [Corynebacterium pseudodiphtheriticum]MDK8486419.1 thioredoxin domain-containing protein [Corynebacterium pseudodiphtheriticum]MDK8493434.1 thioredoxin domain-containing protein [Corynebacterium pseudodiphtheriticum]MDK8551104.1 thioredoxin domain-containing protein [Corynebacterium pseudodiphtheriticum]MDK8563008.1 thioredoxin domain-containing protein [Corynebacterium pseudodiphtheriticum]MDK8614588.1 thioredoxin domain-containing protein [Corynebacte
MSSSRNAFQRKPALLWTLVALVVALAVLIVVAVVRSGDDESMSAGGQDAMHGPQAPSSAQSGNSDSQSTPMPGGEYSPEQARELAKQVEPGTDFSRPNSPDPTIIGPGAEITSNDDILNVHRRNAEDPFAMGALDAPVVLSEFSDFECPFCTRFAVETAPKLKEKFVDTGLLRIEWNDLPVNGPHAETGAQAGRAAGNQGKFYEFHDVLYNNTYDNQTGGHPGYDVADYVRFAKEAGIEDLEKFRTEIENEQYRDVVRQALHYASSIGMRGTPAFILGDRFISGAQPYEVFEDEVYRQLAKVADGTVPHPKSK